MAISSGVFSLAETVTRFTMIERGLAHIDHAALEAGAKEFLRRAQAAMGTYEYGWPPLAESTLAKKGADTPLVETGEMRDSGFYEIHGSTATVGFSDPKMAFHEFGTSHVPPRPVIGPTLDHHMQDIVNRYMAKTFLEIIIAALIGGSLSGALASIMRPK